MNMCYNNFSDLPALTPNTTMFLNMDLPLDASFDIPTDLILNLNGFNLTILDGVLLSNNGAIIGSGTITNNGTYSGTGSCTADFTNNGTVDPGN